MTCSYFKNKVSGKRIGYLYNKVEEKHLFLRAGVQSGGVSLQEHISQYTFSELRKKVPRSLMFSSEDMDFFIFPISTLIPSPHKLPVSLGRNTQDRYNGLISIPNRARPFSRLTTSWSWSRGGDLAAEVPGVVLVNSMGTRWACGRHCSSYC